MKDSAWGYIWKAMRTPSILLFQVAALFVVVLSNSINLLFPRIAGIVIDQYVAVRTLPLWFGGIAIVLSIGSGVLHYAQALLGGVIAEKIAFSLRKMIAEKVFEQPYEYVAEVTPSKILTVFMSDVNFLKQVLGQLINGVLTILILLFGSIWLMYSLNPFLTAVVVCTVPVLLILVSRIFRQTTRLFKFGQEARDRINKVIDENIKASMLVRVFVAEQTEEVKFEEANKQSQEISLKITRMFALILPIMQLVNVLGALFIINIGGAAVIRGEMSIGDLSAFSNYVTLFTIPIVILGFATTAIGQAFASVKRIGEILKGHPSIIEGTKKFDRFEQLQYKQVSYSIKDKEILTDVSFSIRRGERIGVIGLNGSGKTTAFMMLPRLIQATTGEILLNGSSIDQYSLSSLREKLGIAFQENFIIDGTITENILFGSTISMAEVERAAHIAEVDEFSQDFNDGLSYRVGERGSLLSGGQKQRIVIARAVAHAKELLLLDDVTSMLDIATEQKVLQNLRQLSPEMTVIVIAQRIATMMLCDNILVFDQGRVVACGTHDELMKSSALYQEIELTQRNYETNHS